MRITCDVQRSEKRWHDLDAYLASHVLNKEKRFICVNESACRCSHQGEFYAGQLHHVGCFYDLMFDGAALRIVVVGQEYGAEDAPVSLKERYDSIIDCGVGRRFKREGMYKPLNPHMKGTTSVLRLLFGIPLGVDHESEYIRFEDGLQCHIFDAFALVNYLLCSAVKPGSTRGYSTTTMKQNCLPHFRQALEILEPTVIVVQGIGFWPWVRRAFDTVEPLDDVLHRVRVGSQEALLGAFSHPSAPSSYNWGRNERTPYLCDTVRPTVERIRQELFRN